MKPLAAFVLACVDLLGAERALAAHLGGADRQLDRFSPLVRGLYDRPVPEDPHEARVIAELLRYAHDDAAAWNLMRYVERRTLLGLSGDVASPAAANVESAARDMSGEARSLEALRALVLDRALAVEVQQALDPRLEPEARERRLHPESAAVWAADKDADARRALGVHIVNKGIHDIAGGLFYLFLEDAGKAVRFDCAFNGPIAVGASKPVLCHGDGFTLEAALRAVAGLGKGGPAAEVRNYKITYALPAGRFEVHRKEAGFFHDEGGYAADRALAIVKEESCRAKRSCGAEIREGLLAEPAFAGFALGILAGAIFFVLGLISSARAARAARGATILGLMAVLAVAVIVVGAVTWRIHWVFFILITSLAVEHAMDVFGGFGLGLFGSVFAARFIQRAAARRLGVAAQR